MCVVSRKNGAPDSTARSIVPWTEDQAAFAPSKSAGPIGHAAIDPQTGGSAHIGRVIRFFFQPSIKRMFLFADCGSETAQAEGLFRYWIGVTLAKTYERRESFEPHRPIFASRVVLCAPYNVGFVDSFVYNFVRWVWRCLWQRLEITNQSTKTNILLINKRKTGQLETRPGLQ